MAIKVGRNELCPCGSGKKYKQCCESKKAGTSRMTTMMLLVVAAAIVAALLASVFDHGESSAGPGRVWSAEHGHYHDR
jgi:hypothetical protein